MHPRAVLVLFDAQGRRIEFRESPIERVARAAIESTVEGILSEIFSLACNDALQPLWRARASGSADTKVSLIISFNCPSLALLF